MPWAVSSTSFSFPNSIATDNNTHLVEDTWKPPDKMCEGTKASVHNDAWWKKCGSYGKDDLDFNLLSFI